MLGQKKIREITAKVLSLSQADQTEVLVFSDDSQLTRFANSYIHQNVAERDVQVRVRAVVRWLRRPWRWPGSSLKTLTLSRCPNQLRSLR
jgi:hypothetical protein